MKKKLAVDPGTTSKIKTGNWRELYLPVFDHEKCIGCGMCGHICPEGICFSTGEKNSAGRIFYENDLDYCKGCGLCAAVCPVKAIEMEEEKK
jgi:pyruvate ferredoxin oxidoreductase delta subunit